jgi:hypothetical protein
VGSGAGLPQQADAERNALDRLLTYPQQAVLSSLAFDQTAADSISGLQAASRQSAASQLANDSPK